MTPEEFEQYRNRIANEMDAIARHYPDMTTEPTTVPAPQPSLRKAAAEAMLAGALLLSDAQRDSANWQQTCMARASEERFRKALEQLAEELGK